jgi:hypothetical protein
MFEGERFAVTWQLSTSAQTSSESFDLYHELVTSISVL